MRRRSPDAGLSKTPERVVVRATAPRDLTSLVAIDRSVIGDASRRTFLERSIRDGTCAIARIGTVPVGFVVADRSFFGQPFVWLLIVHPAYRRRGAETALVRFVEARYRGLKLFTSTNRSNRAMHEFCKAIGFRRSGIIENLDPGDPEIVYFRPPRQGKR